MTSTMEGSQVKEMLQGFRDSTARVTRGNPNKKFAMSDAELAYRRALSDVFQSDNLMCFFHVKQAARDYIMAHCHGKQNAKEETWQSVSADISLLRGARTEVDFRSRCVAMEAKWDQEGLAAKTTWADKKQKVYDFPSYFFQQWVEDVPEWFVGASKGAIVPSTNNGAESCIKNTRIDAGNVVGSVGETLSFLLSQVESVSQNLFDPSSRQIDASLWRRAAVFSTVQYRASSVRLPRKPNFLLLQPSS